MAFKVVYNGTFGGFSLGEEARKRLLQLGVEVGRHGWLDDDKISRHDPRLVQVVEELGPGAGCGRTAHLLIAEVKGDRYIIREYDGNEWVVEPEDINWITAH